MTENNEATEVVEDTSIESAESAADNDTTENKAEQEAVADEIEEETESDYVPEEVTLEALLEAGAHFGHKVQRWNPKMLPYIYGKKGGTHVINLDLTTQYWNKTAEMIKKAASKGASFMFVGTKEQASEVVKSAAERCGAFYINNRWLGGTLTNFQTIQKSIARMDKMEGLLKKANDPDSEVKLAKKEQLAITKNLEKLSVNLGGIRKMKRIPDYVFIIDIGRDAIAVQEAKKLHIPVIALIDTNNDPSLVDYPVPANDDSRACIELFVNGVADQIKAGRALFKPQFKKKTPSKTDKVESEKVKSNVAEAAPAA